MKVSNVVLRLRFFKKSQDWILKSERIRKRILCFFMTQINPRSLGSWCIKGIEESISRVDSSVPLMHHDPRDLGLICVIKKHKIRFRILSDLRIQSWIFLKKEGAGGSGDCDCPHSAGQGAAGTATAPTPPGRRQRGL